MLKMFRPPISIVIFVLSFFLLYPINIPSQRTSNKAPSTKSGKQNNIDDPNLIRWRSFLVALAQEARTTFPEERRPFAIVDVANAYWAVDQEECKTLYISAFDKALSLTRQDKKYRNVLNYVLSSATKLDAALAKTLNKRLLDDKSFPDKDSVSSKTALDLLEENPEAAAQLAEAFAPNGLQDGSATFLILSLAAKDIRLSNRVYGTYLTRVSANENIQLESIINLGGYAFGYSEYYSVDRRGEISGATLRPNPNLVANPVLAVSFLNLAYRRIVRSIELRNQSASEDPTPFQFPILFAVEYLIPEVARFAPNTLSAWQELQQQAAVGTTAEQLQRVRGYMQIIEQSRIRAQKFNDSSQTPEQEAESSLENVEKLPGTCQRDVVYSKAALTFSSRKNFKRAFEIAKNIEDMKQSADVKEVISINMAETAIDKGDLEEARNLTDKVSSPEHRAILYTELIQALSSGNRDWQARSQIVNDLTKLIESLSNDSDRANISFSLASVLLKTEPIEAQTTIRRAIGNLNKQEPVDHMKFSIPLKVSLSCQGEDRWYGGFETLPNSNVFDALTLLAKQYPEEAVRLADEVGDKITKIRSHAMIARVALTNRKGVGEE